MIQKAYDRLSEICIKELYPRGFVLTDLSSWTWRGRPNTDSKGRVWTKDKSLSSEKFKALYEMMSKASENIDPADLRLQSEGRAIPQRLISDLGDLEVDVFKTTDGKFNLLVPEAFYANRALITKCPIRKTYRPEEKPPFPVNSCRVVLLREGILDDTLSAIVYRGALDIRSYKDLLSSHQGGSLQEDFTGVMAVRKIIETYARSFEIFLEGFTRKEQYSLGLDPLRVVKA